MGRLKSTSESKLETYVRLSNDNFRTLVKRFSLPNFSTKNNSFYYKDQKIDHLDSNIFSKDEEECIVCIDNNIFYLGSYKKSLFPLKKILKTIDQNISRSAQKISIYHSHPRYEYLYFYPEKVVLSLAPLGQSDLALGRKVRSLYNIDTNIYAITKSLTSYSYQFR